jgi:hypothetical protein
MVEKACIGLGSTGIHSTTRKTRKLCSLRCGRWRNWYWHRSGCGIEGGRCRWLDEGRGWCGGLVVGGDIGYKYWIGDVVVIQEGLGGKVGLGIGHGVHESRRCVGWRKGRSLSIEGKGACTILGMSVMDFVHTTDGVAQ